MKSIEQVIDRLMGEFTVESLIGQNIELLVMPEFDDDVQVQQFQRQYSLWCIQTKKLLMTVKVEPLTSQGMFASFIKAKIQRELSNPATKDNPAMKHLFEEKDLNLISNQIRTLTIATLLKDVDDIYNISQEALGNTLDPEMVSVPMAIYTLFALLANDSISKYQYNELFIRSWFDYYHYWASSLMLFKMRGNEWKEDFRGSLLFDVN